MSRVSRFTPGPVEILARMCIQSNRYREDADFRDAVDAVIGQPKYDAAPELLEALEQAVTSMQDSGYPNSSVAVRAARAAIAKAKGEAA